MDFGRALSFVFEDPDWLKKGGIAALVFLIPVIGPILLMGWGLEITRRVITADPVPLPAWDDFGATLTKGLRALLVSVVYSLPAILVLLIMQVVSIVLAAAVSNNDSSNTAGGFVALFVFCLTCFVVILFILAGLIIPAATGNVAAKGELGAGFRLKEVFALFRAAPGAYILVILVIALANIVLAPVGALACGIGVLITTAFTTALGSHLTGQAHSKASAVLAGSGM